MSNEIALATKMVGKLGDRFGMGANSDDLVPILMQTAFQTEPGSEVSPAHMVALMIIADQYRLNPFTKEIYAFPDKKKGIIPIVSVDGWTRIINDHPQMNGMEFVYSDDIIQIDDDAKPCPAWIECIIYRKDRDRPIVIREDLDECYRPAFKGTGKNGAYTIKGPWQTHTKRMLRHKALIQCARIAFGFSGIYDQDEGERVIEGQARAIEISAVEKKTPSRPKAKVVEEPQQDVVEDGEFQQIEDLAEDPAEETIDVVDESTGEVSTAATVTDETKSQPRQAERTQPRQERKDPPASRQADDKMSDGMLTYIRKTATQKNVDEGMLLEQFSLTRLTDADEATGNAIIDYLRKRVA